MTEYLSDRTALPLTGNYTDSEPLSLHIGEGDLALEIATFRAAAKPSKSKMLQWWNERRDGRATPVLIVVFYDSKAALCVPAGEVPIPYHDLDPTQVERLCDAVLDQPDRHAALRFLLDHLPAIEDDMAGLRNAGLFATHALRHFDRAGNGESGPLRRDAAEHARRIAGSKGEGLLKKLGYDVEQADNLSLLLSRDQHHRALAVLLQRNERPESKTDRFNGLSPVSYAVSKGQQQGLNWVILLKGRSLRLYPTGDKGVGARGSTETFVEIDLALLSDTEIGWLWTLFSAEALEEGGTVSQLLEQSQRFSASLAIRLRERIYTETVPKLADAIVRARNIETPSADDLDLTYRMTLLVLFRLLFIAYAEDGDLLPYRSNEAYRDRSLKKKARLLLEAYRAETEPGDHDHHWAEVRLLFEAVDHGNAEWGVPAYNGGLFSHDAAVSPAGAQIATLSIPDADFAPALRSLLISFDDNEQGPVDFRSLGVREFGTIYEGLLESELAVAGTDLTTKAANRTRARAKTDEKELILQPAAEGQEVVVPQGAVYLHNQSGARKSSGSYYTKPFAVEHLLDKALEPALDEHFERLNALDETDAARALFDFRVADIAMGSGHFLIAAIDRIERRFAKYLLERSEAGRALNGVLRELDDLRAAALNGLGAGADAVEIEDTQLLRRLIARRCIYGVDMNDMAVTLARLAVWIHTFVPGLPLAVLDHNLALGNALVGIGSVEEIEAKLNGPQGSLFGEGVRDWLKGAEPALARLRSLADASLRDVTASREALAEAKEKLDGLRQLCDVIVAEPLSEDVIFEPDQWAGDTNMRERQRAVVAAAQTLEGLQPFHFPVEFPEIFLRERPGFDVMLGNPPWKKTQVEEHSFWARYFPGLRGLTPRDRNERVKQLEIERNDLVKVLDRERDIADRARKTLLHGNYPGMAESHPDVYKAFCWRFWHLTAEQGGRFSVVLPRSAWAAKGSTKFREVAFAQASEIDLTMLLNNRQWVFDEVHPQYTIALTTTTKRRGSNGANVSLSGPFNSMAAWETRSETQPDVFEGTDALDWNDTATLPLLPHPDSFEVFLRMREAPRLDRDVPEEWRVRPQQELNATTDKPLFDMTSDTCPKGFWPVFKGENFNLWQPESGSVYGYADPEPVLERLQSKRTSTRRGSAHLEFSDTFRMDPATLASHRSRIAFRDTTRATDTRTVICALVPPATFLVHLAPYALLIRGDESDEAFLVAVMSSIPLDWYARRFVELHLTFVTLNPFPIPRPTRDDPLWQRTVALAGRLAAIDERYADWADAVGVEYGLLDADTKDAMIHELDAVVAHLYRLTRAQVTHIFATFHDGWDHTPRMDAVLTHYDAWSERLGNRDYDTPDTAKGDAP